MTKKLSEAFSTNQVSVTSVASKIVTGQSGLDTVTLQNLGATPVYIGSTAGVTALTGFPIPAGGALTCETTADIYAITGSGSATVAILVEA